jgi:hypothetical protein
MALKNKRREKEEWVDFFLPLSRLALLIACIQSFPKVTSTEKYFVWDKAPILQLNTIEFWFSVFFLLVGLLSSFAAIYFVSTTSGKYKITNIIRISTATFLLLGIFLFSTTFSQEERLPAEWLSEIHGLTVNTIDQIPSNEGEIQNNVKATTKNGEQVYLTLEVKNDKLYLVNQNKIAEK